MNDQHHRYTLGIDFGTDSVRALIVDTADGQEIATGISRYPRWQRGEFCDPNANRFRQHPLDYTECMTEAVLAAVKAGSPEVSTRIAGVGIDTTGSSPVAVDATGTPLALLDEFSANPNAMVVLWKDHTAIIEAEQINAHCKGSGVDYTRYAGGIYSSEWFWAKILHLLREDKAVAAAAYSWVEHCDWIPFLLSGGNDVGKMKRSRCAAGHKALWHPDWEGLPPEEFLSRLDPILSGLRQRLYTDTYTSDHTAGHLSKAWANRLNLRAGIPITVGAFDAHMGAVGGQIKPFYLSKVMGTSTCDILVVPDDHPAAKTLVKGICGQVDGSVLPGMIGLEAGQSAFGDVFAWFSRLLNWPLENILDEDNLLDPELQDLIIDQVREATIPRLSAAAADLPPDGDIVAIDWFNGRRTPDADQRLGGAIAGLNLGSDAPRVFRALVESICFGARRIVERFVEEGIPVKGIIGLGGVAKKSPFVMQTLADVLDRPIRIVASEQTCALGAAMFAAVGAGQHASVPDAVAAMASGFDAEYLPDPERVGLYDQRYGRYLFMGDAVERLAHR